MKTIILILAISFQLSAQSELLLLMSGGVSYEPETLTYQTRVLADGGEIIDITVLNDAIVTAKAGDYFDSLSIWVNPSFGIKKDANNKVTVLYDVTANNNDLIQADTSKAGTLLTDSLYISGTRFYEFTDINTVRSVFWVLAIAPWDGSNRRFIMGDNGTYDFHAQASGRFWDTDFSSLNIRNGVTRQNAAVIDNGVTTIATIQGIISLVTTGNVEAGNFAQDRGSATQVFNGYLWELMISTVPFSDTKRNLIETDLNTKYGIY